MHGIFRLFKSTFFRRVIAFFVIGGLLGQNTAIFADEVPLAQLRGVPYASLASFFPTPLEISSQKTSSESAPEKDPKLSATKSLDKKLSTDFQRLSLHEKRKMAFELLSNTKNPQEADATITNLLQELEIFTNRNKPGAPSVFSSLNKTNTVFGEVTLAYILANPTDDAQELTKRQAIIRELVDNEELFQSLETSLKNVRTAEDGFLAFTCETIKEQERIKQAQKDGVNYFSFLPTPIKNSLAYIFKPLGYGIKAASTSPIIRDGFKRIGDFWVPATLVYATYLGKNLSDRLRETQSLLNTAPATIITPNVSGIQLNTDFHWREYNPFCYKTLYNEIIEKIIEKKGLSRDRATQEAFQNIILLGLANTATAIANCHQAYSFVKKIQNDNQSMVLLHKKLNKTATIVRASKALGIAIEQNKSLKEGFASKDVLTQMFSAQGNQDLSKLLGYLQTKTFTGEPRYFSYSGRVLASETLAKEHLQTMISVMKALGEIDAYMSIAKLYKESQNDKVHHCFATYKKPAATASLSLKGFWHPLLEKESAVPNDLVIDEKAGTSGIILTGSNTGGKSTLLKSVLLNILLAQTFTVSPATAVTITPYAMLGSYLSVSDDIAAGNSLFKAEVLRAKNLLNTMSTLQAGKSAFVVIDELFTGTAADKGSAAACKVANALACKKNLIYILATHFPELTKLEKSTNGRCKNYQIDVKRQSDGSITRPFKISPGVSETSIANDILQEELVDLVF